MLNKDNNLNKPPEICNDKIIKTKPRMLCSSCYKENCEGHNIIKKIFKWFRNNFYFIKHNS